jgi:hypothetical protein
MQAFRSAGSAAQRPVLGLKALKLGDYNGRNLGSLNSSTVLLDPPCAEAAPLRAWCVGGQGRAGQGNLGACGRPGGPQQQQNDSQGAGFYIEQPDFSAG